MQTSTRTDRQAGNDAAMGPHPQQELAEALAEIVRTRMPFGKYGPDHFPPDGVPVYDLPYEYLAYFERRGFPRGRLGELLRLVYTLKRDGADAVFEPFRQRSGGRHSLRQARRRRWEFTGEDR